MLGLISYLLVCVLFGAVSCFFGRRLYFPVLSLVVCLLAVSFSFSRFGFTAKAAIIALVICVIAVALLKFLYKAGVFIIGFIGGGIFGMLVGSLIPGIIGDHYWILAIIFGFAVGYCSARWSDVFIMISTAYSGAAMIASPILFLILDFRHLGDYVGVELSTYLEGDFMAENSMVVFFVTLAIAIVGFIYQNAQFKKHPGKHPKIGQKETPVQ